MGCTEVLLRLQPQLLFQNCNFLFGHMSSPWFFVISVCLPQYVQSHPVKVLLGVTGMMGIVSPWGSIWRCKLHLLSLTPHVGPQTELPLLITNLSTIFNVLGLLMKYHNTITAVTSYSYYHSPFQRIVISVRFPFLQDSCQPGVLLSLCR